MESTIPSSEQLKALAAIPMEKLRRPAMPMSRYLQEADNLYVWTKEDRQHLVAAGLSELLFEHLLERTELCRELQTQWNVSRLEETEAEQQFKAQLQQGFDLHRLAVKSFRYAFRHHPDLLKTLRRLNRQTPYSAFYQSLNNIAVLGESQLDLLRQVGFQEETLLQIRELADELPGLYAEIRGGTNELKVLRDRAYIHLKQVVDEVCSCGKYVFRKQLDRRYGYISPFMRKKARAQQQAKQGPSNKNEHAELQNGDAEEQNTHAE